MTAKVITLANLAESTAQEVYDFVKEKLLAQGKKSLSADGVSCAYRSLECQCAAGFILGDDWKEEFEGHIWSTLVEDEDVPSRHADLISALQRLHDHYDTFRWPAVLADVAKEFNLNP